MNAKKIMLLVGCLILVMVAAPGTWAAPPNVPGQPFQQLQNQIDQLSGEVDTLTGLVNTLLGQIVTGSGMTGFVPKWSGPTSLNDSEVFQDGSGKVGIGTIEPEKELHVVGDMKVTGTIFVGDATTEITEEGVLFPDGSLQITAFLGGAGGGVSEASDPVNWTGTHTWKTDAGPGSGVTRKTFSNSVAAGSEVTLISIPVPDNSMLFLNTWVGLVEEESLDNSGFSRWMSLAQNVGGTVTVGLDFEDVQNDEAGGIGIDVVFEPNTSEPKVDVKVTNGGSPFNYTGWIEYSSVPIP